MTAASTRSGSSTDLRGSQPGSSERSSDGSYKRSDSAFRRWVATDQPSDFAAAPGRYHLYVSLGCPWASRTVVVRALKGLDEVVGLSIVDPIRDERGWAFREVPGATGDPLNDWSYLAEAYEQTEPGYDRERYGEIFGFALGNGNGMFVATIDERLAGVITEYRHSDYGHTLGMLVDEKKLSWDDRVIDHLPDFRLSDAYVTRDLRIRDLLTHRSGLGGSGDLFLKHLLSLAGREHCLE